MNVASHAANAIQRKNFGITPRKSKPVAYAKAQVAALYIPRGNIIDQYSRR